MSYCSEDSSQSPDAIVRCVECEKSLCAEHGEIHARAGHKLTSLQLAKAY